MTGAADSGIGVACVRGMGRWQQAAVVARARCCDSMPGAGARSRSMPTACARCCRSVARRLSSRASTATLRSLTAKASARSSYRGTTAACTRWSVSASWSGSPGTPASSPRSIPGRSNCACSRSSPPTQLPAVTAPGGELVFVAGRQLMRRLADGTVEPGFSGRAPLTDIAYAPDGRWHYASSARRGDLRRHDRGSPRPGLPRPNRRRERAYRVRSSLLVGRCRPARALLTVAPWTTR